MADGRYLLLDAWAEPGPTELGRALDLPCAQIVIDPLGKQVILARDRLGQKPLVWARVNGGVLIASRESLLIDHPEVARDKCPSYLCSVLAGVDPEAGETLFAGIRCVSPGSVVQLSASGEDATHLSFEPDSRAFTMDDRSAGARFRDLLADSVQRCSRGHFRLGISLSAGLDSSSVAALLPQSRRTQDTVAVNYGTRVHDSVDERELASSLSQRLGLTYVGLDTAEFPPSLDSAGIDPDPAHPYLNPYLSLNVAVYRQFRKCGVEVFLTGHFADFWNPGPSAWLLQALKNRRWRMIGEVAADRWRTGGLAAIWRDPGWRYAVRRSLGWNQTSREFDWLRPEWREWAMARKLSAARAFAMWPFPRQAAYNFGAFSASDAAFEGHYRDIFGLESRHPYRDWALLQFALSLPAYQWHRGSRTKWIAREAVKDLLPEAWTWRPKQGGLLPFLQNVAMQAGLPRLEQAIWAGRDEWEPFLDAAPLLARWREDPASASADWLFWQLVMLGIWKEESSKSIHAD